ncbi:MAG: glycosyltransferase family 4 protein [Terriglobales bacterium]
MNQRQRPRSVLYVAYPLLPVSDESAGGAEQMLYTLEREMAVRGHATAVAACAGSFASGEVITTGGVPRQLDWFDDREREHCAAVVGHAAARTYDLIHDKSGSFWRHAGALDAPVLVTLHLPRTFYRPALFETIAANIFFNCVSESQAASFANLPRMMGVVHNGIAVERFPFTPEKRGYLLWMGRICEEKGTHIAIEVAAAAGLPLTIAGQIYPFSYHQRYYERSVRPHLGARGSRVRFVDTPTFTQKRDLLRNARAVLVPSQCEETSSLVALEAMACGTPVIGFRRGAIPEVVVHGETGWVVDNVQQMVEAVARTAEIEPQHCRARVETYYSAARMADDYERLYWQIMQQWAEMRARVPHG